jgi:hypothetical protein
MTKKPKPRTLPEPKNEDSFAHAFWLALGGTQYPGGMSTHFKRIGTFYLDGTKVPSLELLERKVIPKLEEFFPEGKVHHDRLRFYAQVDHLTVGQIKSGKMNSDMFRKAAGYFLAKARERQGLSLDAVQEMIGDKPELRGKLEALENGAEASPKLVRLAIEEITRKLKLDEKAPMLATSLRTVQGILKQFRI